MRKYLALSLILLTAAVIGTREVSGQTKKSIVLKFAVTEDAPPSLVVILDGQAATLNLNDGHKWQLVPSISPDNKTVRLRVVDTEKPAKPIDTQTLTRGKAIKTRTSPPLWLTLSKVNTGGPEDKGK